MGHRHRNRQPAAADVHSGRGRATRTRTGLRGGRHSPAESAEDLRAQRSCVRSTCGLAARDEGFSDRTRAYVIPDVRSAYVDKELDSGWHAFLKEKGFEGKGEDSSRWL